MAPVGGAFRPIYTVDRVSVSIEYRLMAYYVGYIYRGIFSGRFF